MDSDRVTGTVKDLGGKAENIAGKVTGDTKTQADGKIDQVAGQAQSAFGQAKDTVRGAAASLAENASDVGGQVYDKSTQAGAYVGQKVQDQPLAILASVGFVGLALGFLIGRSR